MKVKRQKNQKDLVVKSNHLVRASYEMTAAEHRLITLAMVEARNAGLTLEALEEGKTAPVITIDVKTYAERFNLHRTVAYKQLSESANLLEKRGITFQSEVANYPYSKEYYNWVSAIKYRSDEQAIDIEFNHHIFRMFSAEMVKTYFTQHYLENIVGMNSFFAIRLYEILMLWRQTKKIPDLSVDEFRRLMGIENDKYALIGNLKQRVIDTAISQINKHSDIIAKCTDIKNGKKITAFSFSFVYKETSMLAKIELSKCQMTDPQRALFSMKLFQHFDKFAGAAGAGKSKQQVISWIAEQLKNGERIVEWLPELEAVGFMRSSLKCCDEKNDIDHEKFEPEHEPEHEKTDLWNSTAFIEQAAKQLVFGVHSALFKLRNCEGLDDAQALEYVQAELGNKETREKWARDLAFYGLEP